MKTGGAALTCVTPGKYGSAAERRRFGKFTAYIIALFEPKTPSA